MFTALEQLLEARNPSIEVMLLHSRFFKEDRHRKEEQLRSLFDRNSSGQAILVATQVIEAGLDISCEQLHTELCPMNALIQRSGRCARFEGESRDRSRLSVTSRGACMAAVRRRKRRGRYSDSHT